MTFSLQPILLGLVGAALMLFASVVYHLRGHR